MLALAATARIYLYRSPCDMRKSFDGLCGLVRSALNTECPFGKPEQALRACNFFALGGCFLSVGGWKKRILVR
jgi:hypothetical protein